MILVLSDFHGSLEASRRAALKAEEITADVVVVCGDITNFGSAEDAGKILSPLTALRLPLLFVPGNLDSPSLFETEIEGAKCIHGLCETESHLSFIGAGSILINQAHASPFAISDEEVKDALERGLERCSSIDRLVVVSHEPPLNTKLDIAYTGGHVGSPNLRRFIERNRPHLVFCGHIHEARGIDHIGNSIMVNTGPAKYGHCATVSLNGETNVRLSRL